MENTKIFPIKVYYADTDSAGIVYYGTYMRWMEMGRCEFFSQLGFDLAQQDQEGLILVVARANLNYQRPGRLGDLLQMAIWVTELTGFSFKFNYKFLRQEGQEEPVSLVEAHTLMVCVDRKDYRLQPLPSRAIPLLEHYAS